MPRQASTRKSLLKQANSKNILGDDSTESDDSDSDGLFRSVSTVQNNRTAARNNSRTPATKNPSTSRQTTENARTPGSQIGTRSLSTTSPRRRRSPVASTSRRSPLRRTSRIGPPATAAAAVNPAKERKTSRRKQAKPKRINRVEQEILRTQKSCSNQIPRLPFSRLFREILADLASGRQLRITEGALETLQESAELYLTQLFEDSYRCTLHRARITLMPIDMNLVRCLRGPNDPGNAT